MPKICRSFSNVRKLTMVCVPSCRCVSALVGGATYARRRNTYPTPAHAEALVERHRTLVHKDRLYAMQNTVQLPVLIRHQAYFHDVCRRNTHERSGNRATIERNARTYRQDSKLWSRRACSSVNETNTGHTSETALPSEYTRSEVQWHAFLHNTIAL